MPKAENKWERQLENEIGRHKGEEEKMAKIAKKQLFTDITWVFPFGVLMLKSNMPKYRT